MCGIMGVSFAPNSKIDRRKLAHALLSAGEVRGRDASGFAWVKSDGTEGLYKRDIRGSQLTTASIPQDATSIILHTRAATHGSPQNNDNNHPVLSPSGAIRLVHNGVVYNHGHVRRVLGEVGKKLPEVDTSVIPAMLEQQGTDGMEELNGDAAIAWFDKETGAVLHLARLSSSPLFAATLDDGSTVFASTEHILFQALDRLRLRWFGNYPKTFYEFDEGEYFQLFEGDVTASSKIEWGEYDWGVSAPSWRATTSGNSASWAERGGWAEDDEDEDFFRDRGTPLALSTPAQDTANRDDANLFWAEDHDGDRSEFVSLYALFAYLSWHADRSEPGYDLVEPGSDEKTRWVNHVADIGEIRVDDGEFISWVSKPNEMQDYGSVISGFVRDGIDVLRKVMA